MMELPDLSHLTEEEQKQILSVIKRQQDEEKKEKAMIKNLHQQFETYKEQVKKASETYESKNTPGTNVDIGETCSLCHKTKMAEGSGHSCSYCSRKFCSRCGGRVPVKSSKLMWVCNLCRKQQEMLTKSGAWCNANGSKSTLTLNLEPIPANDLTAKYGKMSGSMSLAQLEGRARRSPRNSIGGQRSRGSVLKKGNSEPQLTNCEKMSKSEDENGNIESFDLPDRCENIASHNTSTDGAQDQIGRTTNGVRRSSTHSDRVLHRQVPILHSSSVENEGSAQVTSSSNTTVTKQPTENKLVNKPHRTNDIMTNNEKDIMKPKAKPRMVSSSTSSHLDTHPPRSSGSTPHMSGGKSSETIRSQVGSEHRKEQDDRMRTSSSSPRMGNDARVHHSTRDVKHREIINHNIREEIHGKRQTEPTPKSGEIPLQPHSASESPRTTHRAATHHGSPNLPMKKNEDPTLLPSDPRPHSKPHEASPKRVRSISVSQSSHFSGSPHSSPQIKRSDRSVGNFTSHSPESHGTQRRNHRMNKDRQSYLDSMTLDNRGNRRYVKQGYKSSLSDTESSHQLYQTYLGSSRRRVEAGGSRRRIESRQDSVDSVDSDPMTAYRSLPRFDDVTQHFHCHNPHRDPYYGGSPINHSHEQNRLSYSDVNLYDNHIECRTHHRKRMNRQDYLDSNAITIRRPHHHKLKRPDKYKRRNPSLSSTDEEREDFQTTPDYSSCEDEHQRHGHAWSESANRDDNLLFFSSPWRGDLNLTSRNEHFDGRNRKKVHFTESVDKKYLQKYPGSLSDHSMSVSAENLSSGTRDSGIDTSSTNTHSDEKEQPVSWQPSPDGRFLIGRMILNKGLATGDSQNQEGAILGLKVVGGKMTESGRLGAFITKVKHGSLADVVGHLQPGDEVVMWNDNCLQNASFDEVYEAVLASKKSKLVELTVSRQIKEVPRIPDSLHRHPVTESSSSSFESQKREEGMNGRNGHRRTRVTPSKIQVRLWFDNSTQQLYVTVLQAIDLLPREGGMLRNPYIKMYLLPDRSEASKRRSKTAKKTLNPSWHQSFVYGPIRRQDLGSMALEVSLWDLDRSVESNNHFLGEIFIDLGMTRLDDTTQWFNLVIEEDTVNHSVPHSMSHYDYVAEPHPVVKGRRRVTSEADFGHYHESDPHLTHHNSPALARHRVDPSLTHRGGNSPSPRRHSPSPRRRGNSPSRRLGTSPSSSVSSINHIGRTHGDYPGGRRVLPSAPQNMRTSKTEQYLGDVRTNQHHTTTTTRSHHHYQPTTSYSKESFHGHEENSMHHNFKYVGSSPRARRSSSGAQSTISIDSSHLDEQLSAEANPPPRTEEVDSPTVMSQSQRISTNQQNNQTPQVVEKLSKSVSLGANLHERNKSPNTPRKTTSTPRPSSRTRAQSTEKPDKKKGKLSNLVGIRSRSQSSTQIKSDQKLSNSTRSSEFGVQPELSREGSRGSASGSLPSLVSEGSSTVGKTLQDFVGGLGPGQVVGRQTLAASSLGDLELSFYETRGQLEVQVIRARNLVPKANTKVLPAPYVKVYLMFGMQCISKKKTKIARRTLDPVFHQTMNFDPTQYGHTVQVIVWGDYGRMDHKAFMGVVQVRLENLDLSQNTIGWYRLFPTTSLIDAASLGSTRPGSMTSLDSDATTFRN
ncbi:regulating synaptic membrane exocytosis protein 2 isoform X3 [Ciona intestinalis]